MKKAKRIEITGCLASSFWYNKLVGCTFDVVREKDTIYVVVVGGINNYSIRKSDCKVIEWEELSYKERQEAWIKEHNLKTGDKVRVNPVDEAYSDEWREKWLGKVKIGGVYKILGIHKLDGIALMGTLGYATYPFFIFEPVKDEYRPFRNAEEFTPYRDKWFCRKGSNTCARAILYNDIGIRTTGDDVISYGDLFDITVMDDGTPAGIKV
jgi:hypothetical protein